MLCCPNDILSGSDEIMSFEQDDKLCKQDIKSFEQHIKSSEQVKKIKLACPFTGSVEILSAIIIHNKNFSLLFKVVSITDLGQRQKSA